MTQGPVDMSDTTKVKNWSFPFKPKAGKLDPIQHLTAMAQASGGYYPVGANGQWHGGVHFDGETEAVFDQSQVCCIADGEVIAYRIDTRHPESQYFNSAGASFNAVFSRSFVLVKHHLEAPAKPTAAGTAPEPPPSLTFFSLYMHLLNWEGYTGTNAPNPPAFMGETLYKVKADKATDPVKGLRIRAEPRTGRVVALIPKGSKVRVGDAHPIHSGWYRLLAVVEGRTLPGVAITENMWVFPGEMEQTAEAGIFLVGERANDLEPTLAPEKGLNVRKNGNGRRDDPIVGVLPLGATFRLESSTGTYCKLKEIVDGKDIAPLSPDSAGNIQGFVHLGSLESTRSAPEPNKVYVLPTPHPIKAGELIGHLGHYQNENDRSPQRLLHLEVFSCEDVPAFIAKSQAWAAGLPDEQKTLLKVHKNASKLIPHRDDINASNPPKISDAGTTVGVDLIIPQSLLDGLPADSKLQENTTLPSSATPTTTRWWRLDNLLADNNGNPISGWLAEQDLITTRHSPWEWEGYDFIQETGSPVGKATYFYEAWRRLTNEESANYRALVSQEDQGPIKARLYDIIRPGGAKGLLTAQEISPALAKPWHAQSIAQLVTHYESEWYWKPDKWDELDPLMGHLPGIDPNLNWASEKERIKELCWWAEMAGKHGISDDGKAWHFQAPGIVGNFNKVNRRKRRDYDLGGLSSSYETGGRGSQTVSGGIGDAGGVSYGSYQMTSKVTLTDGSAIVGGTVKKFINWSQFPWPSEFEGLTPGSESFTQKWKNLVNLYPSEFKSVEHEFIKITHYDIQIEKVLNTTQIDLRYHSHTMNDVVWSTAVQQGPGSSIIINAINSLTIPHEETKTYDSTLIDAIYKERGRRILEGEKAGQLFYFSKNSIAQQEGVAERFISENLKAQELLKNEENY